MLDSLTMLCVRSVRILFSVTFLVQLLLGSTGAQAASPIDFLKNPTFRKQFVTLLADDASTGEVARRVLKKKTLTLEKKLAQPECVALLTGDAGDELFDLYNRLLDPTLAQFTTEWLKRLETVLKEPRQR